MSDRAQREVLNPGRIKGVAFGEFATWYAAHVSADHVASVARSFEEMHPLLFDATRAGYGILATQWYDARLVHAFIDRLVSGRSAEADKLAQAAANDIMNRTLSGVYRFVFSTFATPSLYARHAQKLWNLHYDSGTVSIDASREGEAHATYSDWRGHHPMICRLNMSATVPIYAAMGCKAVKWKKLACVDDGQASCAMLVTWQR